MYHKRIVVDLDDTLVFHQGRDFDNAAPNIPLINKLNGLYDQGWQIDIFTARGSISCNTREEAVLKYKKGIVSLLKRHGLNYNMISFDKPLAAYYIDDKGITPEDFLDVNISELEGGLSGTDIFTDGKVVYKQDPSSYVTNDWFNKAAEIGIKTPTIHRVVGETITMDYISHDEDFFSNEYYTSIGLIQTQLEKMKDSPVTDNLAFDSYVARIHEHADLSEKKDLKQIATELEKYNPKRSFSHGDFGIKNMLFKDRDLYLIDPICGVFGCTEIDAAKFCASLLINSYEVSQIRKSIEFMAMANDINKNMFLALIRAEITRVYKYHPDKKFIMECIENAHQ